MYIRQLLVNIIIVLMVNVVIGRPELPPPSGPSSGSNYQYNPPLLGGGQSSGLPANSYAPPPSSSLSQGPVYGAPIQAPVIHKHIYVHVPPPEPEYQQARKPINYPAPQKHYKIVFIKAPSAPAPTAPIIPIQPQNEEKTLVYVLVKKPDEQPDLVIPTAAPTQPSKPEVYFIRYKTKKQESTGPYPNSIGPAPSSEYGPPAGGLPPPPPPNTEYGVPH